MVGITTAGDCSPEGTIDADHSGHDVHFRSFTGSAKVRMSCNVEVNRTANRIVSYDSAIFVTEISKRQLILKEDKLELRIAILQCQIFPKQERRRRGSNPRSPDK